MIENHLRTQLTVYLCVISLQNTVIFNYWK